MGGEELERPGSLGLQAASHSLRTPPTGSDGGAQDCCLTYSRKEIPASIVRGYRKQNISLGCAMPAIL